MDEERSIQKIIYNTRLCFRLVIVKRDWICFVTLHCLEVDLEPTLKNNLVFLFC